MLKDMTPIILILEHTICENVYDRRLAKGIIMGIVATLCAGGHTFEQACKVVKTYLPKEYNKRSWPQDWK